MFLARQQTRLQIAVEVNVAVKMISIVVLLSLSNLRPGQTSSRALCGSFPCALSVRRDRVHTRYCYPHRPAQPSEAVQADPFMKGRADVWWLSALIFQEKTYITLLFSWVGGDKDLNRGQFPPREYPAVKVVVLEAQAHSPSKMYVSSLPRSEML